MTWSREQQNEASRRHYAANREKVLAAKKAWSDAHPDYQRDYARANRDRKQEWYWRNTYGIGRAEYDRLLAAQGGHCAMCEETVGQRRKSGPRPLFVDHDAITGKVRGLLCNRCNSAIGYMDHRPEVAAAAVRYLTSPPALSVLFGKDEEAA